MALTIRSSFLLLLILPVLVCFSCAGPAEIVFPMDHSKHPGGEEISFLALAHGIDGEELSYVWDFGDGTRDSGDNQTHVFDRAGEYTVTLTITNEFTETYSDIITITITSNRFVKLDASGNVLPDNATSWQMVLDHKTDLMWEVKQDRDFIEDYANVHDADNIYTWYDSNPETNGGNAGEDGDGTDTEDFIAELNGMQFGSFTNWRMPTCDELKTIRAGLRFNPAVNTFYFPQTASGYYWTCTSYEWEFSYSACHIDFMGRPASSRGNHYGYKWLTYYTRAVRDYH